MTLPPLHKPTSALAAVRRCPSPRQTGAAESTVLFDDTDETPWHARNGGKEQGTPSSAQVAALRASAERLFGDEVRNWTRREGGPPATTATWSSCGRHHGRQGRGDDAHGPGIADPSPGDANALTAKAGKHTAKMAIDS